MVEHNQHQTALTLASQKPASCPPEFAVVGIGVTETGLGPLIRFLEKLPDDSGMAYVVVLAGLSQENMDLPLSLVNKAARLPLTLVGPPVSLKMNHLFVIPPGKQVTVSADHLIIDELKQAPCGKVQLELFFRSLADAHGSHAFAILLSDTETASTTGLAHITERGGITLRHSSGDVELNALSGCALRPSTCDLVLAVEDIPQTLRASWAIAQRSELAAKSQAPFHGEPERAEEFALCDIVMQVRALSGNDLTQFKRAAILRAINRRMRITNQPTLKGYSRYLSEHAAESALLLSDLTPTSTHFFRDPQAFAAIRDSLLPQLFHSERDRADIRVWSAGCSTGEEAYSLAMLLCERAARQAEPRHVQVFATDLNEQAIRSGRAGSYPEEITADVRPARLRLFFTHEQGCYRVKDALRERVLFARHCLLQDPPFSHIDLISCRNLLENLERVAQRRVLRMFHFALRPGGVLLLGADETAEAAGDLFTPVDHEHRIYRANLAANITPPAERPDAPMILDLPRITHPFERRRASFPEVHQKVLENYAPPSIIVNDELDIVHMSDHAGRFLRYSAGEPSHNLIKVVCAELRLDLQAALFQAFHTNKSVEGRRVAVNRDERSLIVSLTVKPFRHEAAEPTFALVLFDEIVPAEPEPEPEPNNDAQWAALIQMEGLLQRTKEQLQATMEQAETSTEELRAANEELHAINEELRSATEELETSRQDLQSVNEELITVNDELKAEMEQTRRANNNLRNFIASTDTGTIFVDHDLRIRWFTPRAAELFNIAGEDTGRSLPHVAHQLDYDGLAEDARRVLESLGQVEREVRSRSGLWYLARHRPYRTDDDHIEGVVLSFVDISERRAAEQRLREEEQLMHLIADSASDYAIISMDPDGRVTSWSRGAELIFGYSKAEVQGRSADLIFLPADRQAGAPLEELAQARLEGRAEDERWHVRKDGSRLYCSGIVTPLGENELRGFVKICRDLTQRKQQEMAQELELERSQTANQRKDQFFAMMSHELKHPLNLVQLNAELLARLPVIRNSIVMSKASQSILLAVRNQAQIIDDLLDLSRVRTGKLYLKRTAVDLDQVIGGILNSIHDEIVESRLEFCYDPSSAIGMVLDADPIRVEQVVWNLISNALKFTPCGGRIELILQRQDGMARLDVIDDGPGIDPTQLTRMFDLFDQADNHQALRHKDGLGIGLALVKQLSEAQGGRVEAYSEGLGCGARFSVWLPLHNQPASSHPFNDQPEGNRLEGIRIMLVDDSPEVTDTLTALLELEGAIVTTANSGQAALEQLSKDSHHLLISDIGMPGMDGHQLIEAMRSLPQCRTMPGIALTGFASGLDIERAVRAGFDRHIGKPVPLDALIEAVEAVMDRAATSPAAD